MSIRTVLIQVLITFAWTIAIAFLLASGSNFTPSYSIHLIWSVIASGCSSSEYLSDSQLLTKWNLNSSVWQTRLPPIWLQPLKFLIFTFYSFILYLFGSKGMGWLISLSSFLQNMYWTSPIYRALCLGLMTQRETGQSPCPQSLMAEANSPSQRSAINVITRWISGKEIGQKEMGRAGLAKSMPGGSSRTCIPHFHTSTLFLGCASSCTPNGNPPHPSRPARAPTSVVPSQRCQSRICVSLDNNSISDRPAIASYRSNEFCPCLTAEYHQEQTSGQTKSPARVSCHR